MSVRDRRGRSTSRQYCQASPGKRCRIRALPAACGWLGAFPAAGARLCQTGRRRRFCIANREQRRAAAGAGLLLRRRALQGRLQRSRHRRCQIRPGIQACRRGHVAVRPLSPGPCRPARPGELPSSTAPCARKSASRRRLETWTPTCRNRKIRPENDWRPDLSVFGLSGRRVRVYAALASQRKPKK